MSRDIEALLEPVVAIARAAGDEILNIYHGDITVETKADNSPLTAADRAAHELILARLTELTPEIPVWSEESAGIEYAQRRQWQKFWLVDPLDGTKEFIKRNGEFTVNIALIVGHQAVLGVVHVPVQNKDFYACQDVGAWLREGDEAAIPIQVQRPAAQPLRVVGSRSHRGASLAAFLARLGPHVMVPMGSSLKICLVASGDADIYPRLGPTSEWDTAAAQAVVECAGGAVVDLQGDAIRYNSKEDVLNPHFLVYGDAHHDWLAYLDANN